MTDSSILKSAALPTAAAKCAWELGTDLPTGRRRSRDAHSEQLC